MDKKKDDSCRLQKSSFSPKVGFYLVSTKGGTYHSNEEVFWLEEYNSRSDDL